MKKRIIIIISSIYLLLLPSIAFANGITEADTLLCTRDSSCRESLLLYFRFNQLVIDNDYMENYKTLGAFHALLSNGIAVSLIDTIFITAYASPEGDKTYNIRLAERGEELLIREVPHSGTPAYLHRSTGRELDRTTPDDRR